MISQVSAAEMIISESNRPTQVRNDGYKNDRLWRAKDLIACLEAQKTLTELVDFERLSRGELILSNEEILLSDLLREVLQEGARLTGVAQLDFIADVDIAEGLIVQGDRRRLRQVLVSLIANGAKFTPEGSVLFRAQAYGSTGSSQLTLRFEVVDTGVGIAAHNQERIFHAFAQADEGLQRRFEGAGLGLALAGELVRKMKGHIQLDSKVAQGTRVRVDLTMNQLAREGSHSVVPAG